MSRFMAGVEALVVGGASASAGGGILWLDTAQVVVLQKGCGWAVKRDL